MTTRYRHSPFRVLGVAHPVLLVQLRPVAVGEEGIDRLANEITFDYFDAKARGLLDERGM